MAFSVPELSSAAFESQTLIALATLAWLTIKHFLCDFVLQTAYQAENKGRYGHPGGLAHVAIHGIGSAPLIAFLPLEPEIVGWAIGAEMVVHYHIDWLKQRVSVRNNWTPANHAFWIALGADQLLHYATYLVMTLALTGLAFS
ncbi:MAG: DUF3307 domain-containing protein [Pseudomonadota bacterium]